MKSFIYLICINKESVTTPKSAHVNLIRNSSLSFISFVRKSVTWEIQTYMDNVGTSKGWTLEKL